ncbi:MAG: nucleotide exchange factor GrpE [Sphingobacteriaceae bacterium]|nr:nucleotide exchange factor GrpE [Sphingobacteriaceae bacterium]
MLKKKKNMAEDTPNTEAMPADNSNAEQETSEDLNQQNDGAQDIKNEDQASDANGELEKYKAEAKEANDKYLRLYAEFDNFRRRTSKERIDLLQTAGKDVIVSMLPVIDDFERALKSMETATDVDAVKEGINLVNNKLKNILQQQGLKSMDAKGQVFDADIHEAITNIPAPTDELKGKVIDEVEKGYYLNDKVIRFAKVVVGA